MDIAENTASRLVIVVRPWGQSLAYLGIAVLMTQLSLDAYRDGETAGTFWFVVLMAIISWGGFFVHAQRCELRFNRDAGYLQIARRKLLGTTGTVIPLSAISGVRAERIAPMRQWPWQYRLLVSLDAPDLKTAAELVPGFFKREHAQMAANHIADWLDSDRAAA